MFVCTFVLLLLLFNRLWFLFLMSTSVRCIELTFVATHWPSYKNGCVCVHMGMWLPATNCLWKREKDKKIVGQAKKKNGARKIGRSFALTKSFTNHLNLAESNTASF